LRQKRKNRTFRLNRVGGRNVNIIAKWSKRPFGDVERNVYENILSNLPLSVPRFLGAVDEDERSSWLFLVESPGEKWSRPDAGHGAAAARGMARLHASAAGLAAAAGLPERTLRGELERARKILEAISSNSNNPALERGHREILDDILYLILCLESRWGE